MGLIEAVLALVRRIPLWAWVLVVALVWGGWQRHEVKVISAKYLAAQQSAASEREKDLTTKLNKSAQRVADMEVNIHVADQAASEARASAASADVSVRELRARLAALKASAGRSNPAAPGASSTDRLADTLEQCAARYSGVAAAADRAVIAGQACERAYDSLKKKE